MNYFNEKLYDPYSADIQIGNPVQGSMKTSLFEGRKIKAGYLVPVAVNAKNLLGNYVGQKRYIFLFRDNQLIEIIPPERLALMDR